MAKNTQRKDKILKVSADTPIEYIPKIQTNSRKFISGFEKINIDLHRTQFACLVTFWQIQATLVIIFIIWF